MKNAPGVIRFRGREEKVLDVFSVRGREYLSLEVLSRRGAFRVFDRHAAPGGNYRVLYRFPYSQITRQKVETLRRLAGPNANRNFPFISDCVRQGSDLFVVMEWVSGINLRDFFRDIRSGKVERPSVTETVRLFRGLAHGLSHYHKWAQVVHGDVSPANIILTTGTKNLVLIDFGSAWPMELSATKDVNDGITEPYAAPERIARHALEDFRADVFSHSLVAYEMLTLEIPFDGAGGRAGIPTLSGQLANSYVPPSELIAGINRLPAKSVEQLDELFRIGLALHPDARFATRQKWLAAWDELSLQFRKGSRLSLIEQRFVGCLEFLGSIIIRKKRK